MNYYDLISPLYDLITHTFYRGPRQLLAGKMNYRPGQTVLVPGCGTGQGFEYIVPHIGPGGILVGIDLSEGMLRRAERRVRKHGWSNVRLLQGDLARLDEAFFRRHGLPLSYDRISAELVLTVVPEWQRVTDQLIALLARNGILGVLDWYRPRKDLLTRAVNMLARADSSRPVAGYLAGKLDDWQIHARFYGGNVWVGTGIEQLF